VSATDIWCRCWWAHVSNAEVLQRSGLSTTDDILRHWRLSLAMLHALTLEYQHMMLCVWRWIYLRKQKGNGQLRKMAGSPSQRLVQQGSGGCQRATAAIYAVEIWDRQGPRSGATVHSDYATTTMMMKDDLWQKFRGKLIFQGTYRLPGTVIVERLKIIDGCKLKQFDVEADRRYIFHLRP